MNFPELSPSTLQTVGTFIGAMFGGAAMVFSRFSKQQLQGPKDQNGLHGRCVRDLILDVMVAMENHTSTSEARHVERMRAFEDLRSQFNRLEVRVSVVEDIRNGADPKA